MNPIIRHFGRITHSGKIFFYELELWNQQGSLLAKNVGYPVLNDRLSPTLKLSNLFITIGEGNICV